MVTLLIMDGFGLSKTEKGNAIAMAKTPNIDSYYKNYPNTTLLASGLAVGLPEDTQGNSEVGHINMGAGRVVYQDLTRISKAISDGDFFKNSVFLEAIENCKKNNSALHLMGLITDAGVHAHNSHLFALLKLAKEQGLTRVYIHAILDGRDTPPKSAAVYLEKIDENTKKYGGQISTIVGRYWIMDRDNNNDRVEKGFKAITAGDGAKFETWQAGLKNSYDNGKNDEFVEPIVLNGERVREDDSVIFFNYRKDRAKQITRMFQENINTFFVCFTEYDYTIKGVHIAFPPQIMTNHLGEWLSKKGKKNFRVAETEKYNHVTYYFNALVDEQYEGEKRVLIPSEKVATFDLSPKMRAKEIADEAVKLIKSGEYDLGVINLANPDMLGHTGNISATIIGIETVDESVGRIVNATLEMNGVVLLTADHGNAEVMEFENGAKCTSHTTNPVPFFVIEKKGDKEVSRVLREDGKLGDIAPTILDLLNVEAPREMTGFSLIKNENVF